MKDGLAIFVAMGFGVGRSPYAPGTFGSLPGLALGAAIFWVAHQIGSDLPLTLATTTALLGLTVWLAYWSIARTEKVLKIHDDQRIVVDEVAGQAIAVAFIAPAWLPYLVGFALFRLLDIAKPSLIGKIDREVAGPWGTLGDDLLAGAVAAPLAYGFSLWYGG